ncbi:hypothetical protein GDO81_021537 [Engystomops pustulosus]|uniref:Uncharacterized protein n=1 Tax=Engystomops pustulosus TaxID=76066 RepID=A0AAV6YV79_ENGPU|nr:hypothetical protein GDO81_021537 [Engystomops pustulosus]
MLALSRGSNGGLESASRTSLRSHVGTLLRIWGLILEEARINLLTHLCSASGRSQKAPRAETWTFRVLVERPCSRPFCRKSRICKILGLD